MSFWERLQYALTSWPIEHPLRWLFNKPRRPNPSIRPPWTVDRDGNVNTHPRRVVLQAKRQ